MNDDYLEYSNLDDYLEDNDAREFSTREWQELLDWFDEPLEAPEPDEPEEDYEPSYEYDENEDYDIDYWEDIAAEYDDHEQDFSEFEQFS